MGPGIWLGFVTRGMSRVATLATACDLISLPKSSDL